MKRIIFLALLAVLWPVVGRCKGDTTFVTPFELSGGKQSATFDQAMSYYNRLGKQFRTIMKGDIGITDAGYPLTVYIYTADGDFQKEDWKKEGRIVILVNNDIHAGEPDGVDASMMLLRDAAMGRIDVPKNVVLAIIPIYNIGGAQNRNSTSRINQNGPEAYGFRGNSRNLDLNRDFIKCDAAETQGFEEEFARLRPDLFIDNHVSDGADYQHVITLLASQHDKLGGETGEFMYEKFTPLLYTDMKRMGYDLVPYVNDFSTTPTHGWREFYDPPRFSSGYASLYHTMAYVPETHMLKPFHDRVWATYKLMRCMIDEGSAHANEIHLARLHDAEATKVQQIFPLDWRCDTTRCDSIVFKGYESGYKPSLVSGKPRLYYDHAKPFTHTVPFYDHFVPVVTVKAPVAYMIPKTWVQVISRMRSNGVHIERLEEDTAIDVTAYHIDDYETVGHPYEGHYMHRQVKTTASTVRMQFYVGDYVIPTAQFTRRYIIEALEPISPDGFFVWNYFDGVLQQKEYFSDYVFEDVAAALLRKDAKLKALLEEKRKSDTAFANNGAAQLDFVYRHSPYFEPSANRYPVYRIEEK